MVTIHREAGLQFRIFTDDHEPAHVHVAAQGLAKINLVGTDGAPELVHSGGLKAGDLRKAMRIVGERQDEFLEKWREFHD
jgi:hypothetical protein